MIHEGVRGIKGRREVRATNEARVQIQGQWHSVLLQCANCHGQCAIQRERESIQGGRPRGGGKCGKGG